jgi:hypothetical protein
MTTLSVHGISSVRRRIDRVESGGLEMTEGTGERRRIRVWFGNEVICTHVADPEDAARYATLMQKRFAGLAVTVDDAPEVSDAPLPHALLWEQTVR